MTTVSFVYPGWMAEGYDPDVVEVGKTFTELLFDPDSLPNVTHPSFIEILPGEGVTLRGLPALQAYRRQFGRPRLYSVTMIAIAPSLAAEIPDGSGRRYSLDHLFELSFGLRGQDLPENAPPTLREIPEIPAVVRMREPYEIRQATAQEHRLVPSSPPDQLWVFGRSYWPFGETGPLEPHGQHAFVGRQIEYFARHGRGMAESGAMDPLETVYQRANFHASGS